MGNLKHAVNLLTYHSAGYDITSAQVAKKLLPRLREFGFDGVEPIGIPERAKEMTEIDELSKSNGLETVMITGAWGRFGFMVNTYPNKDPTSSDPKRKRNAVDYIEKCCDLANKFGAPYMLVALGSLDAQSFDKLDLSDKGIRTARRNLVEVLKKGARHARDVGVKLVFEPQCRYEGYYGLNSTVGQVLDIIEEVGSDEVLLIFDTFHASIEETSIAMAIRAAGKKLAHVHFNDSNRRPPGMGSIDFKPLVKELVGLGYKGYLSFECMMARSNPDLMVERGLRHVKSLEAVVDAQLGIARA